MASQQHDRPPETILVAGLGNVLMGDDGAGPWAIRMMESRYQFPLHVTLMDLGTPGLNITSFVSGYAHMIFIDTVHGTVPGTVLTFSGNDLLNATPQARIGPHDPGVHEALWSLELAGAAPRDVLLVGVVPDRCEMGDSISLPIRSALPAIVTAVLAHLQALGVAWTEKGGGTESELWWRVIGDN